MKSEHKATPFVAIGGLGGSGTRVVAQILQKTGFYLGPVLNQQLDNLLFTLLFKRRDWFETFPTDTKVDRMIGLFSSAMCQGVDQAFDRLAPDNVEQLFNNARGLGVNRAKFKAILDSRPPILNSFAGLAWKEPNTHVFLPQLKQQLPNLKYIHVLRNGLDMALSGNHQQLVNWGDHFGVQSNADDNSPNTQLRYWLTANRRAIEFGQKYMGPDQFFLLNYDTLCLNFEAAIGPLLNFLGQNLADSDMAYFSDHIGSSSIGRYRDAPTNTFSQEERHAVKKFGFRVD